ncbi:ADP-ribosylation factor GTPase-activating protein AGD4 [Vitis vinifera]|uniref:ADP-ribosylation factor GTPase-activating protein AGD4 n=1 Tax=Vitis vinifera TaxID=29760 RepID=A0A438EJD9_VITVI|nr:ADP-ribosylation factor GTPase-activating protein AGD4 [Vitis vinifera]
MCIVDLLFTWVASLRTHLEVNSLVKIEAKKKYEFLESFSAIMDAHLRYFKLGYDLLSQLEPFIHQV